MGWGWADELRSLARAMASEGERAEGSDVDGVWSALFNALAAYLEGVRINGERGGESERKEALEGGDGIRAMFEGRAGRVVEGAADRLEKALAEVEGKEGVPALAEMRDMAASADVLASALRLWNASCPPQSTPAD